MAALAADAEAGLESVFPQELGLFADAFPVEARYRFCGHELSIAQHHGAQLGVAAPVWEAVSSPGAAGSVRGQRFARGLEEGQPCACLLGSKPRGVEQGLLPGKCA